MKKKIISLLLLLTLGCTACVTANPVESENKQEETVNQEKETEQEEETEKEAESVIEEEENLAEKVEITVYYPDEMAEKVLTEVVECDELTEEVVWNLLKEKEIISDECEINVFSQENESVELDVNEAFGTQLRSYGTTGEKMMIHCVVNTFLDAFQCEQMKITENGEILCSGHMEYEDYFTKFE
ncbi:MAG: GerMN domain-containing protein [bacterium]|nr:GerMN domain-containing protein [bacterium]